MRKLFGWILALVLAAGLAGGTAAADGVYRAVLEDAGSLMTAPEEERVLAAMQPLTEFCHVGCYTYDGRDSTNVIQKARTWALQQFGQSNWTVFMIDMSTREIGICSGGEAYRSIDKGKANTITDNVYRLATRGDYAGCAIKAFEQMEAALKGDAVAAPMRTVSNILVAVAAAILLAYLVIYSRMQQETEISMPKVIAVTAAGMGTAVLARKLTRTVTHSSSSGGHGGGGGGGGGGGFSSGGGSHGF